jgi:general secretion pathway protein N
MIDRLVLVLLLAGCALAAVIITAEMARTPDRDRDPVSIASSVPEPAPPSTRPEPPGRYNELLATILARPLFSNTRRPPPRGGDNAMADSGLNDTRLTGIVVVPGHRIAIFAPPGAKMLVVGEGETVSGWRVERINPREVSLSGPSGTKTLQPKFDPNLTPPPSPTVGGGNPAPVPVAAAARPGFPPALLNRAPPRPGQLRGR